VHPSHGVDDESLPSSSSACEVSSELPHGVKRLLDGPSSSKDDGSLTKKPAIETIKTQDSTMNVNSDVAHESQVNSPVSDAQNRLENDLVLTKSSRSLPGLSRLTSEEMTAAEEALDSFFMSFATYRSPEPCQVDQHTRKSPVDEVSSETPGAAVNSQGTEVTIQTSSSKETRVETAEVHSKPANPSLVGCEEQVFTCESVLENPRAVEIKEADSIAIEPSPSSLSLSRADQPGVKSCESVLESSSVAVSEESDRIASEPSPLNRPVLDCEEGGAESSKAVLESLSVAVSEETDRVVSEASPLSSPVACGEAGAESSESVLENPTAVESEATDRIASEQVSVTPSAEDRVEPGVGRSESLQDPSVNSEETDMVASEVSPLSRTVFDSGEAVVESSETVLENPIAFDTEETDRIASEHGPQQLSVEECIEPGVVGSESVLGNQIADDKEEKDMIATETGTVSPSVVKCAEPDINSNKLVLENSSVEGSEETIVIGTKSGSASVSFVECKVQSDNTTESALDNPPVIDSEETDRTASEPGPVSPSDGKCEQRVFCCNTSETSSVVNNPETEGIRDGCGPVSEDLGGISVEPFRVESPCQEVEERDMVCSEPSPLSTSAVESERPSVAGIESVPQNPESEKANVTANGTVPASPSIVESGKADLIANESVVANQSDVNNAETEHPCSKEVEVCAETQEICLTSRTPLISATSTPTSLLHAERGNSKGTSLINSISGAVVHGDSRAFESVGEYVLDEATGLFILSSQSTDGGRCEGSNTRPASPKEPLLNLYDASGENYEHSSIHSNLIRSDSNVLMSPCDSVVCLSDDETGMNNPKTGYDTTCTSRTSPALLKETSVNAEQAKHIESATEANSIQDLIMDPASPTASLIRIIEQSINEETNKSPDFDDEIPRPCSQVSLSLFADDHETIVTISDEEPTEPESAIEVVDSGKSLSSEVIIVDNPEPCMPSAGDVDGAKSSTSLISAVVNTTAMARNEGVDSPSWNFDRNRRLSQDELPANWKDYELSSSESVSSPSVDLVLSSDSSSDSSSDIEFLPDPLPEEEHPNEPKMTSPNIPAEDLPEMVDIMDLARPLNQPISDSRGDPLIDEILEHISADDDVQVEVMGCNSELPLCGGCGNPATTLCSSCLSVYYCGGKCEVRPMKPNIGGSLWRNRDTENCMEGGGH